MIRTIIFSFVAFTLMMATPSLSQAAGSVKVGDKIPHNLELKDSTGKMRNFSDLTGKKGLVLVFVRSVEWCPYCQKQLIELSGKNKDFVDAGYNVASVSYDQLEQMKKFTSKNNPKVTLLSDPRSDSIRAFDILNTNSAKGTFSYGIPYPGTFIISKDKKVQAKFFNDGYKDRVSADGLLKKIKELNPPPAPVYESLDNMGTDPIMPGEEMIVTPEKIIEPVVIPDNYNEVVDPAAQAVVPTAEPVTPVDIVPDPITIPENMPAQAPETSLEPAEADLAPDMSAVDEAIMPIEVEPMPADTANEPVPEEDNFPGM